MIKREPIPMPWRKLLTEGFEPPKDKPVLLIVERAKVHRVVIPLKDHKWFEHKYRGCVLLPEGGIPAAAALLGFMLRQEHPHRAVFTAHFRSESTLVDKRMAAVRSILEPGGWALHAKAHHRPVDVQRLLLWAWDKYGWDCDPQGTDNDWGNNSKTALLAFRDAFSRERGRSIEADDAVPTDGDLDAFGELIEEQLVKRTVGALERESSEDVLAEITALRKNVCRPGVAPAMCGDRWISGSKRMKSYSPKAVERIEALLLDEEIARSIDVEQHGAERIYDDSNLKAKRVKYEPAQVPQPKKPSPEVPPVLPPGVLPPDLTDRDLCLTVRVFAPYVSMAQHPSLDPWEKIKLIWNNEITDLDFVGVEDQASSLLDGYVYVFEQVTPTYHKLSSLFVVEQGIYSPVVLGGSSIDYDDVDRGAAASMLVIRNFFPLDAWEKPSSCYIVVSPIRLSHDRVLGSSVHSLVADPKERGTFIGFSRTQFMNPRSFIFDGAPPRPDDNKRFPFRPIDSESGASWELFVTDAFVECVHRAERYQEAVQSFVEWRDESAAAKKRILSQAIRAVCGMNNDYWECMSEEEVEEYFRWNKEYEKKYKRLLSEAEWSFSALVQYMEDPLYAESLRDYNWGDDAEQATAQAMYNLTIRDFKKLDRGWEYLLREFELSESFFNVSTGFLDTVAGSTSAWAGRLQAVRKLNNAVLATIEAFSELAFIKLGHNALEVVQRLVNSVAGTQLLQVTELSDVRVPVLTVGKATPYFASLKVLLESYNVFSCIYQLASFISKNDSPSKDQVLIASLNLSSAITGLAEGVAGLFQERLVKSMLGNLALTGAKVLGCLGTFIDCIVATYEASQDFLQSDIDAGVAKLGASLGAMIAFGGSLASLAVMLGGTGSAVSVLGVAVPVAGIVIAVGLLIYAICEIAAAFLDDDEFETWIKASVFISGRRSAEQSLDDLSEIIYRMSMVDVEYVKTEAGGTTVKATLVFRCVPEDSVLVLDPVEAIGKNNVFEFPGDDAWQGTIKRERRVTFNKLQNLMRGYRLETDDDRRPRKLLIKEHYDMDIDALKIVAWFEAPSGGIVGKMELHD